MLKDKTHITILVQGLSKPKTNKKWKEKWNWLQFQRRKRGTTKKKIEKDAWFR